MTKKAWNVADHSEPGTEEWVEKIVKRLGLESTQRSRGRQVKLPKLPKVPIWLLTPLSHMRNADRGCTPAGGCQVSRVDPNSCRLAGGVQV